VLKPCIQLRCKHTSYTAFHGFGQAKFAYGGWLGFRLKPIYTTAPAAFKNDSQFKSGQN